MAHSFAPLSMDECRVINGWWMAGLDVEVIAEKLD
jgi:hypothetical protein